MAEKLITTREASHALGLSEKEIIDLANAGLIPHFKVGGEFLRFKRIDIIKIKEEIKRKYGLEQTNLHRHEKVKEFFYFNDFYILSSILIVFLVWMVLKDFAA